MRWELQVADNGKEKYSTKSRNFGIYQQSIRNVLSPLIFARTELACKPYRLLLIYNCNAVLPVHSIWLSLIYRTLNLTPTLFQNSNSSIINTIGFLVYIRRMKILDAFGCTFSVIPWEYLSVESFLQNDFFFLLQLRIILNKGILLISDANSYMLGMLS